MKKIAAIGLLLWLLVCWGLVLLFVENQKDISTWDTPLTHTGNNTYRPTDLMTDLSFFVARNKSILDTNDDEHVPQDIVYAMDRAKIIKILNNSQVFEDLYHAVRIDVLKFLIQEKYENFNNEPYMKWALSIIQQSWDFQILQDITIDDALDILLQKKLQGFTDDFGATKLFKNFISFKAISISTGEYEQLWKLFLFKDEQDLRDLWYELISWRSRINADPDYRRHNITTAFYNIGNVRLIMPGEVFSIGQELRYSPRRNPGSKEFVDGYAILGAGAGLVYGGWLCGVATSFYQGALTNLWLDVLESKPHSIYYRNLYEAEINGQYISDPGLDATMYLPMFDVKMRNIRDYPIIAVFNFDGWSGHMEQMFTLAKNQDKGSFTYVDTYKKSGLTCFRWKINGKDISHCYKAVYAFDVGN